MCRRRTLARRHAALEHHQVVTERPEADRRGLQMVVALGEQDRRPPFLDRPDLAFGRGTQKTFIHLTQRAPPR
jgi:hypothetical protein